MHIFGKGAGARGGDGGERGVQLFNKSVAGAVSAVKKNIKKNSVTMLVDIKLYVYCNS